jgi:prevent-host-death family protein
MAGQVGVRELRQNLSKYLDRVKAGENLTVTERGRVVARLVPADERVSPVHAHLAEKYGATVPTQRMSDVLSRLNPPGAAAGTTDAFLAEGRTDWPEKERGGGLR